MATETDARRYEAQSLHYLENARLLLQQGETEKAGELVWGSFAEAIKAVAATTGRRLRAHDEVRKYARELARELRDSDIQGGFVRADRLHANFYEVFLDQDELEGEIEIISQAIQKLFRIVDDRLMAAL